MDLIELKVPTVDGPVSCDDHLQNSEVEKKREKKNSRTVSPSLSISLLVALKMKTPGA